MSIPLKKLLILVLFFSLFFIAWECVCRFVIELKFILPTPMQILSCLWNYSDRFLFHTLVTLKEMVGGILIAFCVAFPLAFCMALWSTCRLIFQPILVIVQCIPMFTLAPIMVLWFDWSYTAIVIPTALMIFFPLTMNLYKGIRSTPNAYLDYFRINQATKWQTFTKLQLPFSLPHIFAGLRISSAIAGIGAIAGEWAGGQSGLGVLMLETRRGMDLGFTFGALFCLTFLTLSFYLFTLIFERKLSFKPLMAILVSLCLTSCQSDTNQVRLLLDWFPNPNHVPLYVGIEKGIFQKYGIPLTLFKTRDPGDAIPYLTSGQVELALSYMSHTVKAVENGAEVLPIGVLVKRPLNSLLYRSGEGIEKPKDLSGKVIGYCVDGSTTPILDRILHQNNIVPKAKRNAGFDLVSLLATKKVDAVYGAYWNIEGEHLRHLGVQTGYFSFEELGVPNYYELVVLAHTNTTDDFIFRFKQALQESIHYAMSFPEEAFEIYLDNNKDKGKEAIEWEKSCWTTTYPILASDQEIDQAEWDSFRSWLS